MRRRAPSTCVDFPGDAPSGSALCLICCRNGEIRRLSLENGNAMGVNSMVIAKASDGNKFAFSAVQISDREIVVGASHPTPLVLDVMSGTQTATLEGGHTAYVQAVSFVPQSQILVSGGKDEKVVLWSRSEGSSGSFVLKCQMEGHTNDIRCLDARCDGSNRVVSGSWDGTARVWDVSQEECVAVLRGHSNSVYGLCHDSSDNQIQFTGSSDETVCCWDFRTNQKIVTLGPFPGWVQALCYRRAKSQLVVPCCFGSLRVIDIRMLQQRSASQTNVVNEWNSGHTASVDSCCDVVDKDFFVTSGYNDGHIKAWRDNGECVWDWSDASAEYPRGIIPFIKGNPSFESAEKPIEDDVVVDSITYANALSIASSVHRGDAEIPSDLPVRGLVSPEEDVHKIRKLFRQLHIGLERPQFTPSKSELTAALVDFFERTNPHLCIVYYSGHGSKEHAGAWILTSPGASGVEYFSFEECRQLWLRHRGTKKNRRLLLIMDSCFSGAWVRALALEEKREGMFIQASCTDSQRSLSEERRAPGRKIGGWFTTWWMKQVRELFSLFEQAENRESGSGVRVVKANPPPPFERATHLPVHFLLRMTPTCCREQAFVFRCRNRDHPKSVLFFRGESAGIGLRSTDGPEPCEMNDKSVQFVSWEQKQSTSEPSSRSSSSSTEEEQSDDPLLVFLTLIRMQSKHSSFLEVGIGYEDLPDLISPLYSDELQLLFPKTFRRRVFVRAVRKKFGLS